MRRALDLAREGHGQIIAAMGEAGLGKSRLLHEFKATVHSDCLFLETFSVSHGKASSYLPVIELLNNYLEIEAGDDARKRREKIAGEVLTLDRKWQRHPPALRQVAPDRVVNRQLGVRNAAGPVLIWIRAATG